MAGRKWIICLLTIAIAIFLNIPEYYDFNNLKDKRVLITGASGGIGEQLAYVYCEFGANIVITARRENELNRVVNACKKLGNERTKIDYIVADMSDMATHKSVVDDSLKFLNGLDQLVLNHADVPAQFLWGEEGSVENLRKAMDVSFISYAALTSHALVHLKKSHGNICVMNSIVGKLYFPFQLSYVASKFALDGFFSSLRFELTDHNVSVTNCFLGGIDTIRSKNICDYALNIESFDPQLSKEKVYQKFKNMCITGPDMASSSETAQAIVQASNLQYRDMYFPYYYKYICMFRDIVNRLIF